MSDNAGLVGRLGAWAVWFADADSLTPTPDDDVVSVALSEAASTISRLQEERDAALAAGERTLGLAMQANSNKNVTERLYNEAVVELTRREQEVRTLNDECLFVHAELTRLRAQVETMLCEGCPRQGYPADATRCTSCPRRAAALAETKPVEHAKALGSKSPA